MTAPGRAPGRARGRVLAAVAVVGGAIIVASTWTTGALGRRPAARLGAAAAVVRGGVRVAGIDRVTRTRGRGRLPLYLAPATGAVIDSARVGALAARLLPGAGGAAPVIALVPRDSVAGLAPVGRLVVTPGEPGLLVFGTPDG